MGAFVFNDLHIKDDPLEEFIELAMDPSYVRDGSVSDWEFAMRDLSAYIAQRFIDTIPELAPAPPGYVPDSTNGEQA
jgi:hypothetical protein